MKMLVTIPYSGEVSKEIDVPDCPPEGFKLVPIGEPEPPLSGAAIVQVDFEGFEQQDLEDAIATQKRIILAPGAGTIDIGVGLPSGTVIDGSGATKDPALGSVLRSQRNLGLDAEGFQKALLYWSRGGATGVHLRDFSLDGTGGNDGLYTIGFGNGSTIENLRFFGSMRHCIVARDNPQDESAAWYGNAYDCFADAFTGSFMWLDGGVRTGGRGPIHARATGCDVRCDGGPTFVVRNGQVNDCKLVVDSGVFQGLLRAKKFVQVTNSPTADIALRDIDLRCPAGTTVVEFVGTGTGVLDHFEFTPGLTGDLVRWLNTNGTVRKRIPMSDFPSGKVARLDFAA